MAKHDPIQEALERLGGLRSAPDDAVLHGELRDFLRNRSNLVIAKAAKLAGERRLTVLVPELAAAFHKLMRDPARLLQRPSGSIRGSIEVAVQRGGDAALRQAYDSAFSG